jgi:Protein of unknown function (DUF4238)
VGQRRGVRDTLNQKKKHHYIAQTYLKGFCGPDGKVCVYSKDRPTQSWWAAPQTIAFEKYYYSQPLPDGGQDNNRLEDLFSSIEDYWPLLVSRIENRQRHGGGLDQLLQFALMHRVRVPTARDAVEKALAESVRMTMRHLNDRGKLPEVPRGLTFEDLDQHTIVSIDPHKSIHAMADVAAGVMKLFQAIGFKILSNKTDEGFITSDNPVIYFDPTVSPAAMQPYNIDRDRMDIEFMFPITPRFMLWGHSVMKPLSGHQHTAVYNDVADKGFVKRANVLAARFSNRMFFSDKAHHQPLVAKYAGTSPVVSVTHIRTPTGRGIFTQHIFGKREPKPKWSALETMNFEPTETQ